MRNVGNLKRIAQILCVRIYFVQSGFWHWMKSRERAFRSGKFSLMKVVLRKCFMEKLKGFLLLFLII